MLRQQHNTLTKLTRGMDASRKHQDLRKKRQNISQVGEVVTGIPHALLTNKEVKNYHGLLRNEPPVTMK